MKDVQFLIATKNAGKQRELQAVLADLGIKILTLTDLGDLPDVEEDGRTFAENSRKKALFYSSLTGVPTIADDSGLEVTALDHQPGVYSARFAPTDEERINKLLAMLEERETESGAVDRSARFVCAICAVIDADHIIEVEGDVHGEILRQPRGKGGFGYDPVFLDPSSGRSFAELSAEEKNRISHRAVALARLKELLQAA
ncbi:MAG: RdgB/HAM1 family non-canonical purine NTP pyrophosphatase [Acidobacteriota bacterium]|nr:MAG: RdgB/HAM1 family non-canonical purine NTP pyrophosphatase [Acidobacteriota bacterium]